MKTNVAVFYGCRSVEHEVSIISAVQAMRAMDREKYDITPVYVTKEGEMYTGDCLFTIEEYRNLPELLKKCQKVNFLRQDGKVVMKYTAGGLFKKEKTVAIDVAFPVVHGTNCEDGTIQGFFEYLNLPYVGCDILSSAVGMDKSVFKDVLKNAGLPVLDCVCFRAREYMADKSGVTAKIKEKIGFPLIIKPVNLGSSVGISKVNDENGLDEAVMLALSFADKILVVSVMVAFISKGYISSIAVIIVILREFTVTSLRLIAASSNVVIAASWFGKAKTVFQIATIIVLMFYPQITALTAFPICDILVWAMAAITVLSGADYVIKNFGIIDYRK